MMDIRNKVIPSVIGIHQEFVKLYHYVDSLFLKINVNLSHSYQCTQITDGTTCRVIDLVSRCLMSGIQFKPDD